jgi:hypothetical protein
VSFVSLLGTAVFAVSTGSAVLPDITPEALLNITGVFISTHPETKITDIIDMRIFPGIFIRYYCGHAQCLTGIVN